jgi:hypothetical protein
MPAPLWKSRTPAHAHRLRLSQPLEAALIEERELGRKRDVTAARWSRARTPEQMDPPESSPERRQLPAPAAAPYEVVLLTHRPPPFAVRPFCFRRCLSFLRGCAPWRGSLRGVPGWDERAGSWMHVEFAVTCSVNFGFWVGWFGVYFGCVVGDQSGFGMCCHRLKARLSRVWTLASFPFFSFRVVISLKKLFFPRSIISFPVFWGSSSYGIVEGREGNIMGVLQYINWSSCSWGGSI